ncbi:BrnT family toxin [Rhodopseudomonas sp. NSM]|uniref:BrnT family toxin n=1 Tax=Rhodopseudomonas sp. NSM TaxID=3457630 RepID=UPI004035FBAA
MDVAGFDWDQGNRAKCEKHGVTRAEIESTFRGPVAVFPDPVHSDAEERFKAIGRSEAERMIFLIFTLRHPGDGTLIRPISARYMHRKEVAHYEEEAAKAGK